MAKTEQFDPVTMELIRNSMESILDDMALTITRTAYSMLCRELYDFGTGFNDAEGVSLAEGHTNPAQALVSQSVIEAILRNYPVDSIHPGDIFINNDPFEGASHIPDIYFSKPIFIDKELVAWASAVSHQVDMGGRVAGSNACDNTEIYQEGLRIPPMKFYDRGIRNETLVKLIEKNTRIPGELLGDVQALIAACYIGERRFLDLAATYGWPTLEGYLNELLNYSERLVRAEIRALPDGVWEFTDFMDNDGIDPDSVPLHVKISIKGDTMVFDLTENRPHVRSSINMPLSTTRACVNVGIRMLLNPGILSNGGVWRPIRLLTKEGTVLHAAHPAAVAGRGATAGRLVDAVQGALGQLAPDKIPACFSDIDTGISFGGVDSEGKPFVYVDFLVGSWGGRPWADGQDACTLLLLNFSNQPVEMTERKYPVLISKYAFEPDSGGPGKYRGGLGYTREFVFLTDGTLQLRTDRCHFGPYGLQGGKPGAVGVNVLNPGRENSIIEKSVRFVKEGDVLRATIAGAGGWGNPFERDIYKVQDDVQNEKVSIEHARSEYAVVIDKATMHVDVNETHKLRREAAAKSDAR